MQNDQISKGSLVLIKGNPQVYRIIDKLGFLIVLVRADMPGSMVKTVAVHKLIKATELAEALYG